MTKTSGVLCKYNVYRQPDNDDVSTETINITIWRKL